MSNNAKTVERRPPPIMSGAILCTIPQAAAMVGRGQTWVYNAIATGQIDGVKSDGRTLVVINSVHRYAAELLPAKLKPHPAFNKARLRERPRPGRDNLNRPDTRRRRKIRGTDVAPTSK